MIDAPDDEPLTLGEAFDGGEDDPAVAPRRSRIRLLVVLCVVGAVVAVVVTVLAVRSGVDDLRHPDPSGSATASTRR